MRANADISEITGMECVKWQLVVSLWALGQFKVGKFSPSLGGFQITYKSKANVLDIS